ncbi:MAG: cytochrome c-type biogenesis protein CcmH [Acidobacteria bacterium]|nr:cytochrome c-type biogenesis protein CcmH [Acidobacteriota bacterium]
MHAIAVWVALVCPLVAAAQVVSAQEPARGDVGTRAGVLAARLMSPYCPGLTLAACPSGAATTLRMDIARRLSDGETPEAIVDDLVARFGDEIRGMPSTRGIGLGLWLAVPASGVLVLAALRAAARRGPSTTRETDTPLIVTPSARLLERLDEELEQME